MKTLEETIARQLVGMRIWCLVQNLAELGNNIHRYDDDGENMYFDEQPTRVCILYVLGSPNLNRLLCISLVITI